MNPLLIAPLLLTISGVVAGWWLPRVASPKMGTRAVTLVVLTAAAGVTAGLVLVTLAGVSELHSVSDWLGWCQALYPGDHGAAPWAGLVAVVALGVAATKGLRYRRAVVNEVAMFGTVSGVEVRAAAGPVAFAVPGRPGGIVVGDELLRALSRTERTAMLAHERAHLRLGHHRYVRAADLCAAAYPFLSPLARQIRYLTERWADEEAAVEVGSRRLVAKAIAKAALLSSEAVPISTLGFEGGGTASRVDALMHPPLSPRSEVPVALSTVAVLTTLAGSSVEVHHLAVFVSHVCGT